MRAILADVEESRELLESIHLSEPAFIIRPGEWEIDLNGDRKINDFEKYLLWLPKPGIVIPNRGTPSASGATLTEEEYYTQYFHKPTIRIDQTDIEWAIAYRHLLEAALNLVDGYEFQSLAAPP